MATPRPTRPRPRVLSAGSIVVVMGAIRNAVRSMHPGQLAQSTTEVTLMRIRSFALRRSDVRRASVEASSTGSRRTRPGRDGPTSHPVVGSWCVRTGPA